MEEEEEEEEEGKREEYIKVEGKKHHKPGVAAILGFRWTRHIHTYIYTRIFFFLKEAVFQLRLLYLFCFGFL